jgi:hypothetical protein
MTARPEDGRILLSIASLSTLVLVVVCALGTVIPTPGFAAFLVVAAFTALPIVAALTCVGLLWAGMLGNRVTAGLSLSVFLAVAWADSARTTSAESAMGFPGLVTALLGIPSIVLAGVVGILGLFVIRRLRRVGALSSPAEPNGRALEP